MRQDDDNPIDWSSFEEASAKARPVAGCGLLKVASGLVALAAIAGIVFGAVSCVGVFDVLGAGGTADLQAFDALVFPGMLLLVSVLSLIPAAFGFQAAASPSAGPAPIVFGVIGLILGTFFAANFVFWDGILLPWVLMMVLASVYLVATCRVFLGARRRGQPRGQHSKDELWDDRNIW